MLFIISRKAVQVERSCLLKIIYVISIFYLIISSLFALLSLFPLYGSIIG
jgi:hypothetical protein